MNYSAQMQKKSRGRPRSLNSARAAAELMNVSERMVYYSRELIRSGRDDLIAAVQAGEMTMAAAIRKVRGTVLPDRYDRLVLAWNCCDELEQSRFLVALKEAGFIRLGGG